MAAVEALFRDTSIPDQLKKIDQWVVWREVERKGKKTKPPVQENGHAASVTNPGHWMPYARAARVANGDRGLGFVLTEDDPVAGIDLDKCIDAFGDVEPWAQEIVDELDSYTEISPSGTGLHILFFGDPPNGRRGQFEIYRSLRYLTVTGDVYHDAPLQQRGDTARQVALRMGVEKDAEAGDADVEASVARTLDYDALLKLESGARALYQHGRWDGPEYDFPSQSEADFYLLCALARAFPKAKPRHLVEAFLGSALARDKTHHLPDGAQKAWRAAREGRGLDETGYDPWEEPAEQLEWMSKDVYLRNAPPSVEWVFTDILPVGLSSIFGDPGAGKSFIALDWSLSVDGPAFYIAGEGWPTFRARIEAWEQEHGEAGNDWHILARAAELTEKGEAGALVKSIGSITQEPRLVIVDTLATNFGGGDENSTADMNRFVSALRSLRDAFPRCAVVVVHHSGHLEKQRARGNTAFKAALDSEFRAAKNMLVRTKLRDGGSVEWKKGYRIDMPGVLHWLDVEEVDDDLDAADARGADGARVRVLQSFVDHPEYSKTEHMAEARVRGGYYDRCLVELGKLGLVARTGPRGRWEVCDIEMAREWLAEHGPFEEIDEDDPLG